MSLDKRGRFPYGKESLDDGLKRGRPEKLTLTVVLARVFFSGRRLAAMIAAKNTKTSQREGKKWNNEKTHHA